MVPFFFIVRKTSCVNLSKIVIPSVCPSAWCDRALCRNYIHMHVCVYIDCKACKRGREKGKEKEGNNCFIASAALSVCWHCRIQRDTLILYKKSTPAYTGVLKKGIVRQ